jgi:hypothetical protein
MPAQRCELPSMENGKGWKIPVVRSGLDIANRGRTPRSQPGAGPDKNQNVKLMVEAELSGYILDTNQLCGRVSGMLFAAFHIIRCIFSRKRCAGDRAATSPYPVQTCHSLHQTESSRAHALVKYLELAFYFSDASRSNSEASNSHGLGVNNWGT